MVALIFVPLSTRDTIRSARDHLLESLSELLKASADKLADSDATPNLDELTLKLDDRMRQLSVVVKPLTSVVMRGQNSRVRHRLALYAAISNDARALTVALRNPDHSASNELADACRCLAKTATSLTDKSLRQENELADVEKSLFADLSVTPDEMAEKPVYIRILQLQRSMQDLFEKDADPL